MSADSNLPLVAFSLSAVDQKARLAEWAELLGQAVSGEETAEGVRYAFAAGAAYEQRIRELAAAEQGCCSFLQFDVAHVGGRVEMAVRAPADRLDALRLIFAV